jgi:hypothetical protein
MILLAGTEAFVIEASTCKRCEGVRGCKALLQAKQYDACKGLDAPHSLQKMVGAVKTTSETEFVLFLSKVTYGERPVKDASAFNVSCL